MKRSYLGYRSSYLIKSLIVQIFHEVCAFFRRMILWQMNFLKFIFSAYFLFHSHFHFHTQAMRIAHIYPYACNLHSLNLTAVFACVHSLLPSRWSGRGKKNPLFNLRSLHSNRNDAEFSCAKSMEKISIKTKKVKKKKRIIYK